MTAQIADAAGLEAMTLCCGAALAIENAGDHAVGLLVGQHARAPPLAAREFWLGGFECVQTLLPRTLKTAGDEAVVGIDCAVAALGARRCVARPFHAKTPLFEGRIAVGFEPLGGRESGDKFGRLEGCNESLRHSFVDLDASDVEAVDAAPLNENLAGT